MRARLGKTTSGEAEVESRRRRATTTAGLVTAAAALVLATPALSEVLPATLGLQLAAVQAELGTGRWQRLERGRPLVETTRSESFAEGEKHLVATLLVQAPPEVVWRVITDFENWAVLFPGADGLRVARLTEDRVRVRHHPEALGISVDFTTVSVLDPKAGRLTVALDPAADNNLDALASTWELIPSADRTRTLVRLRIHVVSGQPIPGWIERVFVERSAERIVEAVADAAGRHRDGPGRRSKETV